MNFSELKAKHGKALAMRCALCGKPVHPAEFGPTGYDCLNVRNHPSNNGIFKHPRSFIIEFAHGKKYVCRDPNGLFHVELLKAFEPTFLPAKPELMEDLRQWLQTNSKPATPQSECKARCIRPRS